MPKTDGSSGCNDTKEVVDVMKPSGPAKEK